MTTQTILNLASSVDVDIVSFLAAPKAAFKLIDTKVDGDNREAVMQRMSGEDEYPMTVRIGRYVNTKSNDGVGQTNTSIKLSTFVQKTDTDDVIWTLPANATLAFSMPGTSGIPDAGQVRELLMNLISFILPVVGGAAGEAVLEELRFGVVNNALAYGDTPSS